MSSSTHQTYTSPFGHVTHEYHLPAKELPSEDRGNMGAWFDGIIDSTPEQAGQVLAARWSALSSPCTRVLRDRLLQFTPYSIIRFGDKSWLRLVLLRDKVGNHWDNHFLSSPIGESDAAKRLAEMDFAGKDDFQEFLTVFGGLRESMPPASGNFINKQRRLATVRGDHA